MLDEYQRRMESGESSNNNAEVALQSAVVKPKNNDRTGSDKSDKGKRIVKRDNKETRTCFFCDKQGHIKADCRSFKKSLQQKNSSAESGKTIAKVGVRPNQISFSTREEARATNTGAWYIDSGATSHMTNDQSFFTVLKDTNMTIFLADGSPVEAAGIGEGCLACKITDNRV